MTRLSDSYWCKRLMSEPDVPLGDGNVEDNWASGSLTGLADTNWCKDLSSGATGAQPSQSVVTSSDAQAGTDAPHLADPNWCKRWQG